MINPSDQANKVKEISLDNDIPQILKEVKSSEKSLNSLSTGSSKNSSRSASFSHNPLHDNKRHFDYNSITDSIYPVLVCDKSSKLKPKRKDSDEACSPKCESPVKEEIPENEEDISHKIHKQIRIVSDGEEFNEKNTKLYQKRKSRGLDFARTPTRCRSSDTSNLPLHKVQETKAEDDYPKIPLKTKFYLENIFDMDEFNHSNKEQKYQKINKLKKTDPELERSFTERAYICRLSSQLSNDEPIQEDFIHENNDAPKIPIFSSTSSNTSSRHSSPRFKLKVDEIDLNNKEKKFFDSTPIDETILEETMAEEGQEYKVLHLAKSKMMNEKEFIKKVIKSEIIDELDTVRTTIISSEKELPIAPDDTIQEVEEEKLLGN